MAGKSTHGIGVGRTEVGLPAQRGDQISVGFLEQSTQRCLIQAVGVHGLGGWRIRNAFLERTTGVGGMGQGLDDDAILVNEDDVSITKDFDVKRSLSVFCIKRKRKNSVKTDLLDAGESSVCLLYTSPSPRDRG